MRWKIFSQVWKVFELVEDGRWENREDGVVEVYQYCDKLWHNTLF